MFAASYSISPRDLWTTIGTSAAPRVIDARRHQIFAASDELLPTAVWRDFSALSSWCADIGRDRPIVVACKEGHELSQLVAAQLRANGFDASVLTGGYKAWKEAGLPFVAKGTLERFAPRMPSLWVTRRRPKIDRVACPWLIKRFIDSEARILFVDPPEVLAVARESGGTPFDIEDVELSHRGEYCSFDTMLELFGLDAEPALARLAVIVRGADTARPDIAPEAAGLHAISLGLSALAGDDDRLMLERGFIIYDALFTWLRFAVQERHNWPAKVA